ncbi:hypothetical protein CRENPOLYSF2_800006 [Crenothrix polyspora]|uniref:Outer membrane protein beta-barrel domain-containing protein n=1 Tax=Crenothrix polyspora TaxID=360316 RepID=A0A1R4HJA1_9GAMM|nr:hypothetical protein CRENPOLYSF2_800006 [Crenothrix polyspora]
MLCDAIQANEHKAYLQLNAGAAFVPSSFIPIGSAISSTGSFQIISTSRYDPSFVTSIALGYHLTEQFRLEGEFVYQSDNFTATTSIPQLKIMRGRSGIIDLDQPLHGERTRTAFLLNAYYDFKNQTPFTPFIMAGVGGYHMQIEQDAYSLVGKGLYHSENDVDLAYQVGAGINYKFNDRFSFDVKYRYFSAAEAQLDRLTEVDDHQLMAGIRIGF